MNTRWVHFLRDFDWTPPERRTVTRAYKAGMTEYVRKRCAEEAVAKGAARYLTEEEIEVRRKLKAH